MGKTIVLGYDGSKCADDALEQTVIQAKAHGNAEVVVVHGQLLPAPYHGHMIKSGVRITETWEEEKAKIAEACEVHHEPMLRNAVERLTAKGLKASSRLVWGDPPQTILDVAEEVGAGLIIIGTYGHGSEQRAGVKRGSMAYKLLHHTSVPVLIVPALAQA
jgi:nucleotide-binding universal stress UspA family protein